MVRSRKQKPRPKARRRYDIYRESMMDDQEQPSLADRKTINDSGESEHQPKGALLTRENLTLFNRMARKKGINGASAPASDPESTVEPSKTKTTSTTTVFGFAMQAYKNGILPRIASKPPTNFEDLRERLARSRGSASPPKSLYDDYADNVGAAPNEATMVVEVSEKLLKRYPNEGYKRVFNQAFTGFPENVGFNTGLSAPQPDFVEGLSFQEYDPFPIDEHSSGAVLYEDDPLSLTLPHLAGEWESRGKNMEAALLQSAYDGAALVFARNQALAYIGIPDPPGHAAVTTFTTDGTCINIFAHYSTLSEDGTLRYHQHLLDSTILIASYEGFKNGRRWLRNVQDYAREQSYALKDQLKEHWKRRRGGLPSIAGRDLLSMPGGELLSTKTKSYGEGEDEDGDEVVEQPCEPKAPTSSKLERVPEHDKISGPRSSLRESLVPVNDYGGDSSAQKQEVSSPWRPPRRSVRQKEQKEKLARQGRDCSGPP